MLREMLRVHTRKRIRTYERVTRRCSMYNVLYTRWWTLARERFTSFPCIVRKGKSSWETQAASNSDGNESSATDEDGEETRKSSKRDGGAPRRSEPAKKKQRNRRKLPTVVYTDAQLFGLLKDVIDRGKYHRCSLPFYLSFSSPPPLSVPFRRASASLWLMNAHSSLKRTARATLSLVYVPRKDKCSPLPEKGMDGAMICRSHYVKKGKKNGKKGGNDLSGNFSSHREK